MKLSTDKNHTWFTIIVKEMRVVMYYKLMDGLALRGWEKLPFALCKIGKGNVEFLNKSEFLALSFCDGITDSDSFFIHAIIWKKYIGPLQANAITAAVIALCPPQLQNTESLIRIQY